MPLITFIDRYYPPAIHPNTLEVDPMRIQSRTFKVAAICIALFTAQYLASSRMKPIFCKAQNIPIAGIIGVISIIVFRIFEFWRATASLDKLALSHFLSKENPSRSIYKYIACNEALLRKAIEKSSPPDFKGFKKVSLLLKALEEEPLSSRTPHLKRLVENKLDKLALFHFLHEENPSRSVYKHIACNEALLREAIEKSSSPDFNDTKRISLLFQILEERPPFKEIAYLKGLVKNRFCLDWNSVSKIVKYCHLEFLEYLAEQEKLPTQKLFPSLSIKGFNECSVWIKVKDEKIGQFLLNNGFNINNPGEHGYTPLDELIKRCAQPFSKELYKSRLDSYILRINTLLKLGASYSEGLSKELEAKPSFIEYLKKSQDKQDPAHKLLREIFSQHLGEI